MHKNKQGFTLAEVLITLGIMGIIAVLTLAVLQKARPNKDKMLFRKSYFAFEAAVQRVLSDPNAYPYPEPGKKFLGLRDNTIYDPNTGQAKAGNIKDKFCIFVGKALTLQSLDYDLDEGCRNGYTYTDAVKKDLPTTSRPSFVTEDGVEWYNMAQAGHGIDIGLGTEFIFQFFIDTNGKGNPPNCLNCDRPDRFLLSTNDYGHVSPINSYCAEANCSKGEEYLRNDKEKKQ